MRLSPEIIIILILLFAGAGAMLWFTNQEENKESVSRPEIKSPERVVEESSETGVTEIASNTAPVGDIEIPSSSIPEAEIKSDSEALEATAPTVPPPPAPVTQTVEPALPPAEPVETVSFQQYTEIRNPSGYVNSEPFLLEDLVGEKVILLKFTTYSCINCQRTYPFVKFWDLKYRNEGLETIFIHTPEFSFEKDIDNVQAAMDEEGITFPVVLDNEYSTWRAYGNRFWPRMYLIDIHGNIVYDHIGEGAYDETDAKIAELIAERKEVLGLE